jgi:hypothetical protein
MKSTKFAFTSLFLASACMLSSCDSPTGTGAAAGAGGGALLGAILGHGRPQNVLAGAALGAGTGALIGHSIGRADDRGYYEGQQLPYGRSLGGGLVESPYRPYNTIDTRGIPHGAVVEDPTTNGRFIKP